MTIISTAKIHVGRGAMQDKTGRKIHTRSFVVVTDDPHDDGNKVLRDAALPNIGDSYTNQQGSVDPKSFCVRRRPEQQQDRRIWHVHCDYEPQDNDLRTQISVRFEKKRKAVVGVVKEWTYTTNSAAGEQGSWSGGQSRTPGPVVAGNPVFKSTVANSFGDPFDPAPEYDVSYPVITIKRVEPMLFTAVLMMFKDAVNREAWGPVPPRCAKMMSIDATHEYRYIGTVEKKIWWVTYQIGIDPDTWDVQKLDAGYRFKYETGNAEGVTAGTEGAFVDKNGNPRIGLLSNEAGVGGIKGIRLVDLTAPEYKVFPVYPGVSWNILNLPMDFNLIEQ